VIPPQAADLDYFLPTASLTIKQSFDKPLHGLRVGDTLTRTVTINASNLRAMLIPPPKFDAPDGIVVYPKQPAVADLKTERGDFVGGRRADSAIYLVQKQGDYTLPPIQVQWWNLDQKKVQTATLPAVHFDAAPNPGLKPELAPEPAPVAATVKPNPVPLKRYLRLALITGISLAAVVLLSWLWWHVGRRLLIRWRKSREEYRHSEGAAFRKLRNASHSNNAPAAYAFLLAWQSRFRPGVGLTRFLSTVGDAELTREVEALAAGLYGHGAEKWSAKKMITALERIRSRGLHETSVHPALPPLNPVGGRLGSK
jgi:hypothetical protein